MKKKFRPGIPSSSQMEAFEERAAIIEFECDGMTREAAEEAAWRILFGNRYLRQTYIKFKASIALSLSHENQNKEATNASIPHQG